MSIPSLPLLSCAEAKAWEEGFFEGEEAKEIAAIRAAGAAVGRSILAHYLEYRPWPASPRLLLLLGRGHNAADALIAAQVVARALPGARFDLVFVFGAAALRGLAAQIWREVEPSLRGRMHLATELASRYDVAVDGVFGHGYRPPLPSPAARWLRGVNATEVALRVAVDLPSGLGEPDGFFADFTLATGILKTELFRGGTAPQAGRIRFLDIGLLDAAATLPEVPGTRVLLPSVLDPLRRIRPTISDKRDYGHLLVLGGSMAYPGAVLMAVRAALRAGAGLVTAFVPEPLVPAYAAAAPEAMWVGWPLTPDGSLALEGLHLARRHGGRGTAWLVGPGLGREPETEALVVELIRDETRPCVIDADALQPTVLASTRAPLVLTPHAGELERIARGRSTRDIAAEDGAIVVAKGSPTWVVTRDGEFLVPAGGPVLARGGAGDLLAGVVGGRVAQKGAHLLSAVCSAVYWHAAAADALARDRGATAVCTTDCLDFLPRVLREDII